MGKPTAFLEIDRHDRELLPASERITNFNEFVQPLAPAELREQASRCMDCGVPYCHSGCPVNNQIPDWNDLIYNDDYRAALADLHSTNNFPEFTGRICPAPCEAACTLNIDDNPVAIKTIECAIVDKGWEEGWITPQPAAAKTGKSVGIIGAGAAGLAAAQQLARAGHEVHLYEKNAKAGGLLRYGIPDFKMEKTLIDRRIEQMAAEGVQFHYNQNIGVDVAVAEIKKRHDAIILSGGSETPRDLPVAGRELGGVHFAMEFLTQQNRRCGQEPIAAPEILAGGKNVIVIGGGDTGSDCIGTSFRQGAKSVTQLEIMPQPPEREDKPLVWPNYPLKFRTSSSQAEGAARDFAVMTTAFTANEGGNITAIECVRVDDKMQAIDGSEFSLPADLVLLAMGFTQPIHAGMLDALNIKYDARGNVAADTATYETSAKRIFACGDMRRGQSLVVWAIREGRQCAREVDLFLCGKTNLPR